MSASQGLLDCKSFLSNFNKNDLVALLLILAFVLIFLKPVISYGDPFAYQAMLEGMGMHGTFNLASQTRFYGVYQDAVTGNYVTRLPIGWPLLNLPLYTASLLLDDFDAFHWNDAFFLQERNDTLIHQLAVIATSFFLLLVLLLVCPTGFTPILQRLHVESVVHLFELH